MEKFKYQKIPIDTMNKQINLRMDEKLLVASEKYARKHGFSSVQAFIKETIRERLFPDRINKETGEAIEKFIKKCDKEGHWISKDELFAELDRK